MAARISTYNTARDCTRLSLNFVFARRRQRPRTLLDWLVDQPQNGASLRGSSIRSCTCPLAGRTMLDFQQFVIHQHVLIVRSRAIPLSTVMPMATQMHIGIWLPALQPLEVNCGEIKAARAIEDVQGVATIFKYFIPTMKNLFLAGLGNTTIGIPVSSARQYSSWHPAVIPIGLEPTQNLWKRAFLRLTPRVSV